MAVLRQTETTAEDLARAILGEAGGTKEKAQFSAGGNNTQYYAESVTDPAIIIKNVGDSILRGLISAGERLGYSPISMAQFWEGNWTPNGALGYMDSLFKSAQDRSRSSDSIKDRRDRMGTSTPAGEKGTSYYLTDPNGFNDLVQKVWDWYGMKAPVDLGNFDPTGGSRGGGGGGRGPSAEDIRNSYDIDQLTEAASNIWRANLLEDTPDARKMATAYVDAMVAGKGQVKIDFTTFIREKAKKTARHASIYRNKPDAMTDEDYIGRYYQSAMQVVRPDNADEIAIGGAQFGASAGQFAERLQRTEENTSSTPFLNELHGRLSDLNKVFKG